VTARAAAFRQSDLTRAIRAAQAAGLTVTRAKVAADGEIEMEFAAPDPDSAAQAIDLVTWRKPR
jgi:hypothetical protein